MRREAGHTPDGHTSRSGVPSQPAGVARADRDAAFIDNVSRHLRHHPQAQVYDDQGRLRPPSREEADRIAQVALRAAAQWLTPVQEADDTQPLTDVA